MKSHLVARSVLLLVLLLVACAATNRWPSWADRLAQQLDCGMDLRTIEGLASREVVPWTTLGRLRTAFISKGNTDLVLYLDDKGLAAIAVSKVDTPRVMSTRLTPLKCLCTGELMFLLRLTWTEELEHASIYLDGQNVAEEDWLGPYLGISAGRHELRLEKEGYEPIVKQLDFGPFDQGNPQLLFSLPTVVDPPTPPGRPADRPVAGDRPG